MAEEENVELTAEEAQDAQVEQDGISDEDLDRIADTAIATIQDILKHFDVGEVTIDEYEGDEGELILDITGDDLAVLIGRHGKTLDALQFLVSAITVRTMGFRYPVIVDVEGYKNRQREKLESIARNAAAKAANADHFIRTLPGGYQMELNEDASNVSQGQKQLLTIARTILADNRILILDEATSSVDTRTEQRIQTAMDRLMQGRTSFVIAHRLSTIRDADLILVMRDGDIVEQGTHDELIDQGGFYADLYNSQFEDVTA